MSVKDSKDVITDNNSKRRISAAQIRVQKDITDLNLPKICRTEFPDPDDLLNFLVIICPDEGFYKDGEFIFQFNVENNYPHEPPKVKCKSNIYHPNIDTDGNICLNILREEWNPVLTINSVVYGLISLLLEPNSEDALNQDAANTLKENRMLFQHNVHQVIRRMH